MQVQTIQMDPKQAEEKLKAYKAELQRKHFKRANSRAAEEYRAAKKGYEALANGFPLLDLGDVMRRVPIDAKHRPKVALARSDRDLVRFVPDWGPSWASRSIFDARKDGARPMGYRDNYDGTLVINIELPEGATDPQRGFTRVPIVPADVRREVGLRGSLKGYFTMWEVEEWQDEPQRVAGDRDPLLLQHLSGNLYIVKATWDLTDLEASILSGRPIER